jgi:hypothetical protein
MNDDEDFDDTDDDEAMAPGAPRAVRNGCTCRARSVRHADIDPPEVTVNEWCPLHGRDPDYERDRKIDAKLERD